MERAQQIQTVLGIQVGNEALVNNDFNQFQLPLEGTIKTAGIKLDTKENKQFIDAIITKNPDARLVVRRVLKEAVQPLHGVFEYKSKAVEFERSGKLRNSENVPLNPTVSTSDLTENYFKTEILSHVSDVWVDVGRHGAKDDEVGIVGYEISLSRHFYICQPPRPLFEIDTSLDAIGAEIMKPLQKIHS